MYIYKVLKEQRSRLSSSKRFLDAAARLMQIRHMLTKTKNAAEKTDPDRKQPITVEINRADLKRLYTAYVKNDILDDEFLVRIRTLTR